MMASSICLSTSKTLMLNPAYTPSSSSTPSSTSSSSGRGPGIGFYRCCLLHPRGFVSGGVVFGARGRSRSDRLVVRMAPEEEKLTRRNPLDFPVEWTRPRPGRRPDIFPQFSPMKTPLPPPIPFDPPEEDEEEEEKKEEEEEDPEQEETENPEQQ